MPESAQPTKRAAARQKTGKRLTTQDLLLIAVLLAAGAVLKLTKSKPYRTGYDFLGWAEDSEADEAEHSPEKVQLAMLQAIINMAKINDEVPEGKFRIVEQCIAKANLPSDEKLGLLEEIESEKSYDVDFDLLAANRDLSLATLDVLTELVKQDEKVTMAEKIYFNMVAQKLGFSKEELDLSFLE